MRIAYPPVYSLTTNHFDGKADKKVRLKQIKKILNIFHHKCKLCNCKPKNIWKTSRWASHSGKIHNNYYCCNCLSSKEDVLREVDTDESLMGLAYCDSILGIRKLDYTRYYKIIPESKSS